MVGPSPSARLAVLWRCPRRSARGIGERHPYWRSGREPSRRAGGVPSADFPSHQSVAGGRTPDSGGRGAVSRAGLALGIAHQESSDPPRRNAAFAALAIACFASTTLPIALQSGDEVGMTTEASSSHVRRLGRHRSPGFGATRAAPGRCLCRRRRRTRVPEPRIRRRPRLALTRRASNFAASTGDRRGVCDGRDCAAAIGARQPPARTAAGCVLARQGGRRVPAGLDAPKRSTLLASRSWLDPWPLECRRSARVPSGLGAEESDRQGRRVSHSVQRLHSAHTRPPAPAPRCPCGHGCRAVGVPIGHVLLLYVSRGSRRHGGRFAARSGRLRPASLDRGADPCSRRRGAPQPCLEAVQLNVPV